MSETPGTVKTGGLTEGGRLIQGTVDPVFHANWKEWHDLTAKHLSTPKIALLTLPLLQTGRNGPILRQAI